MHFYRNWRKWEGIGFHSLCFLLLQSLPFLHFCSSFQTILFLSVTGYLPHFTCLFPYLLCFLLRFVTFYHQEQLVGYSLCVCFSYQAFSSVISHMLPTSVLFDECQCLRCTIFSMTFTPGKGYVYLILLE